jgi:hypothetical protein
MDREMAEPGPSPACLIGIDRTTNVSLAVLLREPSRYHSVYHITEKRNYVLGKVK